jgi:hypothetical protein
MRCGGRSICSRYRTPMPTDKTERIVPSRTRLASACWDEKPLVVQRPLQRSCVRRGSQRFN